MAHLMLSTWTGSLMLRFQAGVFFSTVWRCQGLNLGLLLAKSACADVVRCHSYISWVSLASLLFCSWIRPTPGLPLNIVINVPSKMMHVNRAVTAPAKENDTTWWMTAVLSRVSVCMGKTYVMQRQKEMAILFSTQVLKSMLSQWEL